MAALPSEDDIIATLFAPIAGPGALGLEDDAALIAPPVGHEIVATADAIVAGVHFYHDDPPASIARKALRVNLSDLAAKGADPLGFLLTMALPAELPRQWLEDFAQALGADARTHKIALLGGDTVKTPGPLTLSITALGFVPMGRMVLRTGARAGDCLYVSGTIGDAALGLRFRASASPLEDFQRWLVARYLEPQPRNALASALRDCASGGMDVSDGLVGDCAKMLRASGVSAEIDLRRVPLSDAARAAIAREPKLFEQAMTGGDDYEILASVAPGEAADFERMAAKAGVPVARIGDVVASDAAPVFLGLDGERRVFASGSYSHF